jgi:hypothetical protein
MLLFKFASQDLPKVLKRHLSRTIVVIAIGVIALQWIILGPWGSDKIRNVYLGTLLTNKDDMSDLFSSLLSKDASKKEFLDAARDSRMYVETDGEIIDRWQDQIRSGTYSDDFSGKPNALQIARERAATAAAPFQPLGTRVTASSPDCKGERPDFQEIFFNDERRDLRAWQPGQLVRVSSQDGRGEPVIARVAHPKTKMPLEIQLYMNKTQFAMLRQWEPSVFVLITPTKRAPNETSQDVESTPKDIYCPN